MSGFVIYLVTLGGSVLFFKRFFSKLKQARYWSALISFVICLVLLVAFNLNDIKVIYAKTVGITAGVLPDGANNPMGVAQGIFPGRVIWARNQSATKASCPNTSNTDCFFMESNNNQDTINKMADNSIKKLAGGNTVKDSWDALFKYFNNKKTGTATGYTTGQTIFIKVNNGQAGWDIDPSTLEEPDGAVPIAETTPATVLAFIRQLVDSCAIPQNKIYLGEPMTHIYQHLYTVINDKYPNVKILDKDNFTGLGRTTSAGWTNNSVIVYSDKADVMQDAGSDAIMKEMYNADYLINIAAMKAHARNGVSLCAKLHFGSHWSHGDYGYGSFYLHPGLLSTTDNDVFDRTDYHMYRVLVDLMGHKKLGGNTVLFVIDGLWAGTEGTENGVKWKTFNNNWPNSLFLSQDMVAIESVGLDFLRAEAVVNSQFQNRPLVQAVDDYIHQAADPANWPTGISYDPNNSGTPITSLGVHEHWNNSTDRQYTRDLYTNGTGIDLVSIPDNLVKHNNGTGINSLQTSNLFKSFPNPFRSEVSISYSLPGDSKVSISICNISGQVITKLIDNKQMAGNHIQNWVPSASLQKGTYLAMICVNNSLVKCLKLNYN